MPELSEYSSAMESTLKNADLKSISINLAESLVDNLIEDGFAKEIPIIGTLLGVGKVFTGLREQLFLKKIIFFMSELADVPADKRFEMITSIDESDTYRTKVGEKLLYIIDTCEDHEKAQLIAAMFRAFIEEDLNYDEFLKSAQIIDNIILSDLIWLVNSKEERFGLEDAQIFLNTGLLIIEPLEISVQDQWDHKRRHEKYLVEGGEITAFISELGKKIRQVLRSRNHLTRI